MPPAAAPPAARALLRDAAPRAAPGPVWRCACLALVALAAVAHQGHFAQPRVSHGSKADAEDVTAALSAAAESGGLTKEALGSFMQDMASTMPFAPTLPPRLADASDALDGERVITFLLPGTGISYRRSRRKRPPLSWRRPG